MNWLLLTNSLMVSGLTTLLAMGFGLVAALFLSGLEARWRVRLLAVAVLALALPPFLVTNCWLDLLGSTGVWHRWLPLNIFSLGGTIWILALLLWPITLLVTWSAWRQLERAQLESDMAVTGWALVRGLLWPLGLGPLAQAAVLTFVLALNNFAVPAILQVKVFPAEMWVLFNTSFDTLGAVRMGWPLVLGPLVLLIWFFRRPLPWPHLEGPVPARLFRQQLGAGWFWSCGLGTSALCLLAVGLPLYQLVSVKRTWTELPGAIAAGQGALWNSCWLAGAAATLVLALSLAGTTRMRVATARLAWFKTNFVENGQSDKGCDKGPGAGFFQQHLTDVFTAALWLFFLVPGVWLGIGLIALFNRSWSSFFYESAGIVILAFVMRYLAVGWTTSAHAWASLDRDLTDAARLVGANRWQMLRYVHWPQLAPRMAAAWYIIFLLCLWDVESMILVVPPGGETLALRIFNLLHYGHNAQVNALCLTLLLVALAPLLIWHAGDWVRRCRELGVAASGLNAVLLAVCLAAVFAGCAPRSGANDARLTSSLFSQVRIIGTRGVGVGQLNKPRSVAVDAQDNLYVVDMTGRVQKFSPQGVFLLSWQMPQTELGKPKGMCPDRHGNIIVLEPHYQRVNCFSPTGHLLAQWGQRGTNAGQFMLPRAVAVNSHDEIYVSEYGVTERIQRFALRTSATRPASPTRSELADAGGGISSGSDSTTGQFLNSFGHAGNQPGELNRAEGLFVDRSGQLYVADSCNHRIEIFSREGNFIRAYGKAGSGKGELSYPYDICVDGAGRQYVCEFGNSRIQVFDAQDQPIEIIGGPGAGPGQFSNPWSIALDSAGNLYVADALNHRVQKLIRKQ